MTDDKIKPAFLAKLAPILDNRPKVGFAYTHIHAEDKAAEAARQAVPSAAVAVSPGVRPSRPRLRIVYLIRSILGVTGGNQTLLRQAEEMRRRGHQVTIVTHSPKPDWFRFQTRVVQSPAGQPMASAMPPSDVVVATSFITAIELCAVQAPVKVYYAQGDQFVFGDATMADTPQNRHLRQLSQASYLLPGIRFVPNSKTLAEAVQRLCARRPDGILPVCTDQTIFRPLQRPAAGSRYRLLIVGPDSRGTAAEPLLFKGMQDIHDALQILGAQDPHFTPVRMSSTAPDIFSRVPCKFYITPGDEMKTALYGRAHIHIYASHYDSCPRPPQEAMAAGCAVVCTATSGAMEYCRDGENALLVPIRSPAAIAAAVRRLMHDHPLREKLVQGGLATARQYPREREWNEWEDMLYRFMDEAAKPAGTSAVSSEPAKPPGKPNLLMSLGLELVRSGNLEAGLERDWEAFHLLSARPAAEVTPEERETLLTQLTTHLMAAKRYADVVHLWQSPFAKSAGLTASQHFSLGLAHIELKQPAEAAEQMRQCLAKRHRPALCPINREILKAGPQHCLALCLTALKETAAARNAFEAALTDEPSSRPARFDLARFEAAQGRTGEALKLLQQLAAENPAEARVWDLGGQIALSRPEHLEWARTWTGQAIGNFPDDQILLQQRAEALLLNQDVAQALPLWRRAQVSGSLRQRAALLLCELLTGDRQHQISAAEEPAISQEVVQWYRHCIRMGAHGLIHHLHQRMETLRLTLPTFVRVCEAAHRQVRQAAA